MKRPIIRLEDGTEVIETTGDLDALQHGGGVLYRDPVRRDFYWQFWRAREEGEKNYEAFTAPVPDNVFEYYEVDIQELCRYSELQIQDVRRLARSKNPSERLQVVVALRDVYGASRVDPSHEPEILTPWEISARWGDVFGLGHEQVAKVDIEDFIVRETAFKDYECGCVDGTYFGRFKTYKNALCAVADFMRRFEIENVNLFHEHAPGQLELVKWEPETFTGKIPKRRAKIPEAPWRNSMRRYTSSEERRKGVDRRNKRQKHILRDRKRKAAKFDRQERRERALALRRNLEEMYS